MTRPVATPARPSLLPPVVVPRVRQLGPRVRRLVGPRLRHLVGARLRHLVGARLRHLAGETLRASPRPVQQAVRRGSSALLRALAPTAPSGPAATAPTEGSGWRSPPVPLPDGVSLADLQATFGSWSVNGEPVGHLQAYVDDSLWRFLYTWDLVKDLSGTCLELGANPYFTTFLLDSHTDLELCLANFYGTRGEVTETVSLIPPGRADRIEVTRTSRMFNVEEDPFPFDTASMDVVLFCEMLEHLLMNPVAALREIHRVLKPGGVLVLTTPNVARLGNVLQMLAGANIYDPYSGYGPYGRHNREYTRHELHRLLAFAGFDVERSLTADGHDWDPAAWPGHAAAAPLVSSRRPDLGHYLFVRARKGEPGREGLPGFLYRSWPEGTIVAFD